MDQDRPHPKKLTGTPEEVAAYYMRRKGFPEAQPVETVKVEYMNCWYFYYELDDGEVELEVFYGAGDSASVRVTTYTPKSKQRA